MFPFIKNVFNIFGRNIQLTSRKDGNTKFFILPQHDYSILMEKIDYADVHTTEKTGDMITKKTYPDAIKVYTATVPYLYKCNGFWAPFKEKLNRNMWIRLTKVDCEEEIRYLIVTKEFAQSIRDGSVSNDRSLVKMLNKCILISPKTIENYDRNSNTVDVSEFDSEN